MLIPFFRQIGFRLLKTGFKPVFGFTDLHKNILLYEANNFMYYVLLTVIISSLIGVFSLAIITIHSFIHYGDLYSTPSRFLLRSAPDPCTAKKKSFESRVECVRKNPGKQSLRQRKPIPHRGTNHRECTGLGCG